MKVLVAPLNKDMDPLEIDLAEDDIIDTLKEKILERLFPVDAIDSGQLEVKLQYLGNPLILLYGMKDGSIIVAEIWRSERVW